MTALLKTLESDLPVLSTLRVDASARKHDSVSRQLGDALIDELQAHHHLQLTTRDLSRPLPLVDADWVAANNTPLNDRSAAQQGVLAFSDKLVEEVEATELLVLTTPIYNFGVPAALKLWIDLIARAGRTFRYTSGGPIGLLENKRAIVLVTSGGTRMGSDIDFTTPYLKHVLGFIGIDDVRFVAADAMGNGAAEAIARARVSLQQLAGELQ
ncbi:MAG: NAD(P)H-dependent oxidoreductase [Pseudomonadota bacterium]